MLVEGYERLRERVLAGRPDGWRLGHGLLAGKGLAAWVVAATALASSPRVTPSADHGATMAPPRACVSGLGADQLVTVLAQMALAHT